MAYTAEVHITSEESWQTCPWCGKKYPSDLTGKCPNCGTKLKGIPDEVNPTVITEQERAVYMTDQERAAAKAEQERMARERLASIDAIWVTSGYNFEGHTITSYRGFISEETAVGMGFFKGFASSVSNVTGTESDSLRKKLLQTKQIVMYRLREDAYEAGANAIIGIDLDYTMFGDSIVGVIVSGTAVTIVANGFQPA